MLSCPCAGRILRKKKAKPGQAASAEEYDAFFYTLVTLDTQAGGPCCLLVRVGSHSFSSVFSA